MPKDIFSTCADLPVLRTWVNQKLEIPSTENGNFWLPLVCTQRGVLYAEVITKREKDIGIYEYHQPYHLQDALRQTVYRLGRQLLDYLAAPPAVYLMQFDYDSNSEKSNHNSLLFDRLIPFPDRPADASIGVQEPNLYECHLLCTTNQPIYDLVIKI